ncbi:hypothetical protein AB0L34_02960 [Micromonospora sp. NPDC052213]
MTKEVTDPAPSDASYAGVVEEAWPRHLRYVQAPEVNPRPRVR